METQATQAQASVDAKRAARVAAAKRDAHAKKYPGGCRDSWRALSVECPDCCKRIASAIEPHPEVVAFKHVLTVLYTLDSDIKSARGTIERFKASLDKDPAYAFEWGTQAVEAAAQLWVYTGIAEIVRDRGLDVAFEIAKGNVLRGARWPQHSTAAMSNLTHEFKTAAWAEFVSRESDHRTVMAEKYAEQQVAAALAGLGVGQ